MAFFKKKTMHELQRIWKEEYPNHLIVMQVGVFYESYEEEAEALSEITKIKLYIRKGVRAAGFPTNALDKYIEIIESSGHQVAVFHETEWEGKRKKRELRYLTQRHKKESTSVATNPTAILYSYYPKIEISKLEWALLHAKKGWFVIPIVPREKRPLISDWQKRATTNPLQIRAWWEENPNANIGIACEPSNIFILDLDVAKGENSPARYRGFNSGYEVFKQVCADKQIEFPPATYSVVTPSGGIHYYFNDEATPVKQGSEINGMWRVDTRSKGGYIIAEGSEYFVSESNQLHVYKSNSTNCNLEILPSSYREILTPRILDSGSGSISSHPTENFSLKSNLKFDRDFALKILHDRAQLIRTATKGNRNDTLLRHSFYMGKIVGQGVLTRAEVEEVVLVAAIQAGLEEIEAKLTMHNGITGGIDNTW